MHQRCAITLLLVPAIVVFADSGLGQPTEWQSIGPYGASIVALSSQPGAPEVVYAGGFASLFRSTDGGATWAGAWSDLPVPDFGALLVTASGEVYAGAFLSGVYRSTDSGASFVAANAGMESASVFALALDPGGSLWAGTSDSGVYRSTDSGTTWDPRSVGLPAEEEVRHILPVGSDTLYAATSDGVYISTDSGANWTARSQGLTNRRTTSLARRADGTVLYVGTTTTSTQESGVYRSVDGGENWALASTGLLNNRVADILIDPSDPDILLVATETNQVAAGVYRSTDAGDSWAQVPGNPARRDTRVLEQAGSAVFVGAVGEIGARGGVFRSTDGLNFERSDRGIVIARGRAAASFPGFGDELLVGTEPGTFRQPGGVYRTVDGGTTWEEYSTGLVNSRIFALSVASPTLRYAATGSGVWRRSAEVGELWQSTSLGSGAVYDLAQSGAPGDSLRIWAATDSGIFYSPNGATFVAKNNGLARLRVRAIVVDRGDPDLVHAGTDSAGVFRSTDGGDQWESWSVDLGSLIVRDLVGDGDGRVFAATAGGVFELVGSSWVERNAGLTDLDVRSLAAYRSERYAATPSGVFRQAGETSDSWLALNDGLPTLDVRSVYADTAAGRLRLFAATEGHGFYFADEPTPVLLSRVETLALPGRVELRFTTVREWDHVGFHVERQLTGERGFSRRTTELLTGGPEYRFVDIDARLTPGTEVLYRLLAFNLSGAPEVAASMRVDIPYEGPAAAPARPPSLAIQPSPFTDAAWVAVDASGRSTVRVIDSSGRLVRQLAVEADGLVRWDGRNHAGAELPAGVYFFELAAPGGRAQARAVKIR